MKHPYNHPDQTQVVALRLSAAWLSAALLVSLLSPALALGQAGAEVAIAPPVGDLVAGQPTTLDIVAQSVNNLYGAELHLRFDPAVVRLEDGDDQQAGLQLTPGSLLDPTQGSVIINRADNQAGTAVFAITLLNPAPAVEGSGVLARLTVVPLQPGVLRIELESIRLITRDMQTLDVSARGLQIQVADQASPSVSTTQPVSEALGPTPDPGASPAAPTPIWVLVLVALVVVGIPLASAWLFLIRKDKNQAP